MAASRPGDRGLRVRSRDGLDGTRVLGLAGDLDHDNAEALRGALTDALAGAPPRLLVDFTEVGFCDSTGLNVLLRTRQEAASAGTALELCGLGPQAARLFEMTGAATVFTIRPTAADALGPGD